MKKRAKSVFMIFSFLVCWAIHSLFLQADPQETEQEKIIETVVVSNIEVPVRVYDGKVPVTGLKKSDQLIVVTPMKLVGYSAQKLNIPKKKKLLKYSGIFRKIRGDNNLLMFLEREYRPIPDKESMQLMKGSTESNTGANLEETFLGEDRYKNFKLDEIIPIFKYAYVRFHFLYLKGKNVRPQRDIDYVENMGELYGNFSKLAKATKGVKLTSIKPQTFAKLLRKALIQGKVETEVVDQSIGN